MKKLLFFEALILRNVFEQEFDQPIDNMTGIGFTRMYPTSNDNKIVLTFLFFTFLTLIFVVLIFSDRENGYLDSTQRIPQFVDVQIGVFADLGHILNEFGVSVWDVVAELILGLIF